MDPLVSLAAASIALIGTHISLSHPLRAPLVARLGAGGFLAVYSLVAIACLAWIAQAFRAAPAGDLGGAAGVAGWTVATLLTLPALVLFLGSLRRNPAFPTPGPAPASIREPKGVFAVTRHPMIWGFALWAIAHLALAWSWRTTIVALAILVLALLGAHLQDRKKAALMGADRSAWMVETSYWPRWGRLLDIGTALWLAATAIWLLVSWLHIPAGVAPAGLWRWVG